MRRKLTPRQFYRILHRIADGSVRQVEQAYLKTIRKARSAVDTELLRRSLDAGDVDGIIEALKIDATFRKQFTTEMAPVLRRPYVAAGVITARAMPQLNMRFDLTNPRALRWATRRAAELVTEVMPDTKRAIRRLVAQSFREGKTTKWLSQTIRRGDIIGLHSRQMTALANFAERMQRKSDAGRITEEWAGAQVERYQERLLRQRARTIARTETIRASSEGQNELWQQGIDDGTFDAETTKRVWIVTPDEAGPGKGRTCLICLSIQELNPDGVPIGSPYQSIEGPIMAPPAHPNCRCAEGLEFEYEAAAAAA